MRHILQHNNRYVGELLVKEGLISSDELALGLTQQKENREFLCLTLVRLGFASEEKIFSLLSLQIGVPFVNLAETKADPLILTRLPARLCLGFKCLPFRVVDGVVYVAMSDPLNATAAEEIKASLGVEKIKVFLCGDSDLREAIRLYYGI